MCECWLKLCDYSLMGAVRGYEAMAGRKSMVGRAVGVFSCPVI